MTIKILSFEKLNIYYEAIRNKIPQKFSSHDKAIHYGIDISPINYSIMSNYVFELSEGFKSIF